MDTAVGSGHALNCMPSEYNCPGKPCFPGLYPKKGSKKGVFGGVKKGSFFDQNPGFAKLVFLDFLEFFGFSHPGT